MIQKIVERKQEKPKAYIQNRENWCWAAACKMVGQHYKQLKPRYQFTIEKTTGLTTELRRHGFVSPQEMRSGTATFIQEGLRYPCERDGQYYVDAWQRAIVINANTQEKGKEGNVSGDDEAKMNALRYVVTGSIQPFGLRIANLGHYNDTVSLLDQYRKEIEEAFASGQWMVGNYIVELTQRPHSVTLIAETDGRVRLFDPWDGFCEIYTLDQIFRTGFLTNQGKGLVKWVQYIG